MVIVKNAPKHSLMALTVLTASTLLLATSASAKQVETSIPNFAQPSTTNTQTLMAKKVKVKIKDGDVKIKVVVRG